MPTAKEVYLDFHQAFGEFKTLFSKNFFSRENVTQIIDPLPLREAQNIFDYVWSSIDKNVKVINSKEQLDRYFENLITETQKLAEISTQADSQSPLAAICKRRNIPVDWLNRNENLLVKFFLRLMYVYHLLLSQQLLLKELSQYENMMQELNQSTASTKNEHYQLDAVCFDLYQFLRKKEYDVPAWPKPNDVLRSMKKNNEERLHLIKEKLQNIPSANKLKKLLSRAIKQEGISEEGRFLAKARAHYLAGITKDIEELSSQLLSSYESSSIDKTIKVSELDSAARKAFMLRFNQNLFSFENTNQQLKKGLEALSRSAGHFKNEEAATKISSWQAISQPIKTIANPYLTSHADEKKSTDAMLKFLNRKVDEDVSGRKGLQEKIAKAKKYLAEITKKINHSSDVCHAISQIEPPEPWWASIGRHWGKMIGVGLLLGVAAGVAGVFFALGIIPVAAMIAGAIVVGAGLTLLAGVAIDYVRQESPLEKLTPNEINDWVQLGAKAEPELEEAPTTRLAIKKLDAQVVSAVENKKVLNTATTVFQPVKEPKLDPAISPAASPQVKTEVVCR